LIIVSSPVPPTPALHHHHLKPGPSKPAPYYLTTGKDNLDLQTKSTHSATKLGTPLVMQNPSQSTLHSDPSHHHPPRYCTMARKRIDGNKNTPHLAPWILLLVLLTRLQEHLSQKAMQNLEEKKGIEGLKGLQVVEKWRRRRRETKETEEREGERERERREAESKRKDLKLKPAR